MSLFTKQIDKKKARALEAAMKKLINITPRISVSYILVLLLFTITFLELFRERGNTDVERLRQLDSVYLNLKNFIYSNSKNTYRSERVD